MNIQENLAKAQKQFKKNKIFSAELDAEILLLEAINREQKTKNKEQRTKRRRHDVVSLSEKKEKFFRRRHSGMSPSNQAGKKHKIIIDKTWLCARPEYELNKSRQKKFESFVKRRLKGEPIAYIISRKEFFGLDFYVDKRAMIPRPETEIIIEKIVEKINIFNNCHSELVSESVKKRKRHDVASLSVTGKNCCHRLNIIDIGTGSGCVSIALAKNIQLVKASNASECVGIGCLHKFYAIDISRKAIEVAKINAKKNKIFSRIKFLKGNLFKPIQKLKIKNQPTIIIANLPYLKTKDIKKNISLTYEPISALDGGEDGLEKIKELIIQIKKINFNIFECWLEINPEQANTLIRFVKKNLNGIKIKMIKDLSGQNRFLKINKN